MNLYFITLQTYDYFKFNIICIACKVKNHRKRFCNFPFTDTKSCEEKGTCDANEVCAAYGCCK